MQTEIIELIEPTPKLKTKKCRLLAFSIGIFLQFSAYIVTALVWYVYDFFIAIFAFLLSFIVVGIIRSKLRNSAIPFNQREYNYNDQGIADWFCAKVLCYEEE